MPALCQAHFQRWYLCLGIRQLRSRLDDVALAGFAEIKTRPCDPEVFLLAAQRMGVEPSNCAVIEDAVAGIAAALAGGMTAIALAGTAPTESLTMAHLVVTSLRQLTPKQISELILRRHHRG